MRRKRIKEIGAIGAAVTIGLSFDMVFWHAVSLWVFLDLMTTGDDQ